MKEKVLGVNQEFAMRCDLDVIDLMLIAIVKDKMTSQNTRKITHGGKRYVWVSYQGVIDHLPVMRLKKQSLSKRMDILCSKGIIFKQLQGGSYTYFRLADKGELARIVVPGGSYSDTKSGYTMVQPIEIPVNKKPVRSKEKDINKFISKKKVAPEEYDLLFDEFKAKALKDIELSRNLKDYKILNTEALLDEFQDHVIRLMKVGEFANNGYIRNRQWLLNSMSRLDLSEATGVRLGIGEYMRDGRRYYVNPRGKSVEVPIDAPPRQLKSQIWYSEQSRWGPDI